MRYEQKIYMTLLNTSTLYFGHYAWAWYTLITTFKDKDITPRNLNYFMTIILFHSDIFTVWQRLKCLAVGDSYIPQPRGRRRVVSGHRSHAPRHAPETPRDTVSLEPGLSLEPVWHLTFLNLGQRHDVSGHRLHTPLHLLVVSLEPVTSFVNNRASPRLKKFVTVHCRRWPSNLSQLSVPFYFNLQLLKMAS